jgi:MinD-like ATPase involved in chromosome partitioning or flagellar assembly
MREGDSRDAPDWARNLEGEAEGQTPPESETSTEEEPDVSEPTLSPPNWAEESDWDKTTLSPHPPVTVVDTDHVDGPPEWLADVIDQTEPQARIPDKSYLDEFNEDGSEEKDAVAIDEETPWEELFEEVTADLDDSDLLGFSEDIPAPPGFENKPDPVWDVVTIVGDRPPPRRLVQGERIKVIAFTVPKGGTGKTATAAYGSWVLASVNKRVLYLDANSQQADGAGTFDMASTSPSIVDLAFRDETESHMPVTRDSVHHVLSNISGNKLMALFGPSDPRQANPLVITPQLYAEALDAVADEFDYVIIDSPIAESYRDIIDEFILARADFVACVVTPNWQTVTNTYKWLLTTTDPAYAGSRAYPSEQIGWFFNRYESDVDFDDESAEKTLQPWRFLGRIPDLKTVRRAANRGDMPMDLEYIKPLLSVFHEITHDESLGVLAEASEGKRKHFGWR